MEISELTVIFSFIAVIFALIVGITTFIKKTIEDAVKPLYKRFDDIATVTFVQAITSNLTRELVGMKKKVVPTINIVKALLVKNGIKVKSNGDYIGDLSHLYNIPPEKFLEELKEILQNSNKVDDDF